MNPLTDLDQLSLPPAVRAQLQCWAEAVQQEAQTAQGTALRLAETLKRREAELTARDLAYQKVVHELAQLKRLRYGVKSEALSGAMRDLFDETLAADIAACEARLETLAPLEPAPARAPRQHKGRAPLPAHLERIEHRHEPESCNCGQCGADLVKIGEDVSEQLDIIPSRFIVQRHIRPQYACRACETVQAAPVPAQIIDGGVPTARMLAWVTTSKYVDHLPLYRIEAIGARDAVPLARSTLADWIGRIGVALEPLAERLREILLGHDILHADETPVQQLDPGKGKTKRAYLWAYRTSPLSTAPPIVLFDYHPGRSGEHARQFLGLWAGFLMVDDYAGYKALFARGITELGCMAHARRKFFELAQANASPEAMEALKRIGALYAIEANAQEADIATRARLRAEQAVPRLEALHLWLIDTRKRTADGSALARALDYSLKRWPALARYATRGDLPIDNNPVENAIRPIAIGKKNWLFAGSEAAGKRAAAIQSLLATAKANGIEPMQWLTETLEKLPIWPNSRIDELLPITKNEPPQV